MSRRRSHGLVPAVALLLAVSLSASACAGLLGGAAPSASSEAPASSDAPATEGQIAEAAEGWGAAPQYVLTTSAAGFEAVPIAAGVFGPDGFSLQFSGTSGRTFMLSAVEGSMTADDCAAVPVLDVGGAEAGGPVTCGQEDGAFRRTAAEVEEYVVLHDDALVRISGSTADHDALREAAANVRVPTSGELAALVAGTPRDPGPPAERGDLPPGDGAPDNSVGLGG
ncbi:hypothetical protein AAG589_04795 [Isoptericola sp. F-RaC21]|uniref:hypothetical protein n=1 Tax=Isoptericola sp. F-RaC21 TaxID=3141452 RepID=UPI00315B9481